MSKRSLTRRSVLFLLLSLLLCAACLAGCNKPADPTTEPEEQTTVPTTTQPTETTTTPPGVADSIFDNNGQTNPTEPSQTTQPTETTVPPETTKPEEPVLPETTQPPTTVPPTTVPPTTVPPTTVPPTTVPPTTVPPTTVPPTTEPTQGTVSPDSMTYEAYNALSASEQKAFMNSFASIDKFFEWYNAAKKAYEDAHPPIDVGDGNIDIGDLIGGNG